MANADNLENKISSEALSKVIEYDEMKSLQGEYQEYKKLMQTLIESAAHELKSPVANLKLITLLVENTQDGNELLKYLDSIKTSINRLNASIIGLAKIFQTINQEPVIKKAIKINEVIDEAIAHHKYESGNLDSVEINNYVDSSLSLTYPFEYLQFIFKELIENSIKYRRENDHLHISFRSQKEGEYVKIMVEDNGLGMDLVKYGHNLFKVFKRFSQNQVGSGIGLFTIKTMIEKNKGKIQIDSKVNEGTKTTLFFKPYNI